MDKARLASYLRDSRFESSGEDADDSEGDAVELEEAPDDL
jgi:hypothetical protein